MSLATEVLPLPVQLKRKRESQQTQDEIEIDVSAPEPPSKKVLRKFKKKGIATAIGDRIKSPDEKLHRQDQRNNTQDTSSNLAVQKASEYAIWIGNLPWTATKDDLMKFLTSNSTIGEEYVTRIHMPVPKADAKLQALNRSSGRRPTAQNKGFAYIDFSTELAKIQAIALSERLLTGRAVLIKDALSFEGRPKPTDQDSDAKSRLGKPPARRIFVGNLAFDVTKEDVEQHFAKCGQIEEVFLATFEDSGKCKGYGWVMFDSIDAASAAVRGWNDIEAESEEDEEKNSDLDGDRQDSKKKKRKPRKWWVNRMRGRSLRIEFAEDPTTRYNKRFGKEAKATKEAAEKSVLHSDSIDEKPGKTSGTAIKEADDLSRGKDPNQIQAFKARKLPTQNRATGRVLEKMRGNIVTAEGKKTTFE